MLITVKQAAEMLTISPSLVYALVSTGRIPAVRFGTGRGTIRLDESDVRSYLEATRLKPTVEHEFQHLRIS